MCHFKHCCSQPIRSNSLAFLPQKRDSFFPFSIHPYIISPSSLIMSLKSAFQAYYNSWIGFTQDHLFSCVIRTNHFQDPSWQTINFLQAPTTNQNYCCPSLYLHPTYHVLCEIRFLSFFSLLSLVDLRTHTHRYTRFLALYSLYNTAPFSLSL